MAKSLGMEAVAAESIPFKRYVTKEGDRLIGLPLIGNYGISSRTQRFQDQMKSALEGLSPSERLIAIQEVSADYCIQVFGCGDDITEHNCESCEH